MGPDELLDALRHLPDQVRDIAVSASDVDNLPDVAEIREVILFGVGGSQVAADVVESLCEIQAQVPVVATGAQCPAWVSSSTLAVAISQSGDDATVDAVAEARDAGATVVAVTSGGRLRSRFDEWQAPVVAIDPESGPAAGLGVAIVPVMVLLERLGFVDGTTQLVSSTATQLATRLGEIADPSFLRDLAEALPDRVAIVAGAGSIGKHAARRWVQQLDRIGGVASVRRRLPTGAVDIDTGLRLDKAVARGSVLIMLRHSYEPAGLDGGVDAAARAFDRSFVIPAGGDSPLAQLLDLVLVADALAALLHDEDS